MIINMKKSIFLFFVCGWLTNSCVMKLNNKYASLIPRAIINTKSVSKYLSLDTLYAEKINTNIRVVDLTHKLRNDYSSCFLDNRVFISYAILYNLPLSYNCDLIARDVVILKLNKINQILKIKVFVSTYKAVDNKRNSIIVDLSFSYNNDSVLTLVSERVTDYDEASFLDKSYNKKKWLLRE